MWQVKVLLLCSLSVLAAAPSAAQAQQLATPKWGGADAEAGTTSRIAARNAVLATGPATDVIQSPSSLDDFAYNKDFWNSRFGRHTLGSFPGFTTLASSVVNQVFATDFDPDATTLYGLNSSPLQLVTINQTTGALTVIGPSVPTVVGQNLWSGMAIDPVNGVIYAAGIAGSIDAPYALYTIDKTTGTPTLIGSDAAVTGMIAIAMNCAGELYGHDIVTDAIYRINPATGAVTLIGSTGVASNFAQGMDFDNETGLLYAWTYQGGGTNQFGTIDLATGHLTALSTNNPTGEFEGAIRNQCFIFRDGYEAGNTSAWTSATSGP